MDAIQAKLKILQKKYTKAYENIIKELEKENIFFLNETQLDKTTRRICEKLFSGKSAIRNFSNHAG
jgi:polyphosphate kinase